MLTIPYRKRTVSLRSPADVSRVVAYLRVSTEEQANSGAGLQAQRDAIAADCARRGWPVVEWTEDAGASGSSTNGRPGLDAALEAIEGGRGDVLMISKVDRLSRSLTDFSGLMDRARRRGWQVVALDLGIDGSTPSGEMMANVLAVFAQFERRLIGARTKEALAVKKAQGVRVGRPSAVSPEVTRRIKALRKRGRSYWQIADELNAEGVPTGHGGAKWYPATVRYVAVIRS